MHVQLEAVGGNDSLPKAVDVVVIGGGIVGAGAAYALAKAGHSVALIEKGLVGGEQSSRNWGWCRQLNRDLRELELSMRSMEIWDRFSAETGEEAGFRRSGLVYGTDKEADVAAWTDWLDKAKEYQIGARILTGDEVRAKLPKAHAPHWIGGIHSPNDGHAEPGKGAPAFARAARAKGAVVLENCAVRGLDIQGGRVVGVVTEKGRIAAQAVIGAGGAWASMLCRFHGVDFPQASVQGTAFQTTPVESIWDGGFYCPGFALRRRDDGSYTVGLSGRGLLELTPQGLRYAAKFFKIFLARRKNLTFGLGRSFFEGPGALANWKLDGISPFERIRTLDPGPDAKLVAEALGYIATTFPALKGVGMARGWGGVIDSTPDAVPVISPVEQLPGFVLAAGFSGHGFGIGPGAGQLAADLATGARPIVDPAAFSHRRFIDGSAIAKPGAI